MSKDKRLGVIAILSIACISAVFCGVCGCGGGNTFRTVTSSPPNFPRGFRAISPTTGTINVNPAITNTFTWQSSDPGVNYNLEIANDDVFVSGTIVLATSTILTSYSVIPNALSPNQWYYWRVVASSPALYQSTVNTWAPLAFYTGITGTPPGPFTLSSPPDGATNVSTAPELAWTNTANEIEYLIYVSLTNTFASYVVGGGGVNVGTLSFQFEREGTPFIASTKYYWRIMAQNPFGNTSSAIFSFTTAP